MIKQILLYLFGYLEQALDPDLKARVVALNQRVAEQEQREREAAEKQRDSDARYAESQQKFAESERLRAELDLKRQEIRRQIEADEVLLRESEARRLAIKQEVADAKQTIANTTDDDILSGALPGSNTK